MHLFIFAMQTQKHRDQTTIVRKRVKLHKSADTQDKAGCYYEGESKDRYNFKQQQGKPNKHRQLQIWLKRKEKKNLNPQKVKKKERGEKEQGRGREGVCVREGETI